MRIDFDIKVDLNLLQTNAVVHGGIERAIKSASEALLTEANKTAPKDEGTLIQSGKTDYEGATQTGYVSYDTPYAVRLHEHPEYNFQNGRRGKWLELTYMEQKNMLSLLVAQKLREALAMGGGTP